MYKTWIVFSLLIFFPFYGGDVRQAQVDLGSLLDKGMQANDSKNYTLAIQVCTRGLSEAQSRGNKEYIPRFLYWLAFANEMAGNYNVARNYYTRSTEYYPSPPQRSDLLHESKKTYFHLGVTCACLSEWETALDWFKKGETAFGYANIEWLVKCVAGHALMLVLLDQNEEAIKYVNGKIQDASPFVSVVPKAAEIVAAIKVGKGLIALRAHKYQEAKGAFEQALEFFEKSPPDAITAIYCRAGLAAACCGLKEYPRAEELLNKVDPVINKEGTLLERTFSAGLRGAVCEGENRLDEAGATYAEMEQLYEAHSDQILEASVVSAWLDVLLNPYMRHAALLYKQGKIMPALLTVERGRGRGLVRLIAQHSIDYENSLDKGRLLSTGKEPELPVQQQQNRAILNRANVSGISPPTEQDIEKLAADHPDTLYLEYVVMEEQSLCFVYSGKEPLAIPLIGAQKLQKLVSEWRNTLPPIRKGQEKVAARKLYDALIAPLEEKQLFSSKRYKRLVVVPDGPLAEIPFAVLLNGNGKRLFERYPISISISLGLLRSSPIPPRPVQKLLCAAEAPPRDPRLPPLPPRKINGKAFPRLCYLSRTVAQIALQSKGDFFFDRKMQKALMQQKMPDYDALILATHGVLNARNGLRSWLLMGEDSAGDIEKERMEGFDIASLSLKAQIAILMACESAIGQKRSGEGLIGLAWAFRGAGCPCVVGSLWSVDVTATGKLIEDFWAELRKGKPKDEAMQTAMGNRMNDPQSRDPYFWAAFPIIGDARPLFAKPVPQLPKRGTKNGARQKRVGGLH